MSTGKTENDLLTKQIMIKAEFLLSSDDVIGFRQPFQGAILPLERLRSDLKKEIYCLRYILTTKIQF